MKEFWNGLSKGKKSIIAILAAAVLLMLIYIILQGISGSKESTSATSNSVVEVTLQSTTPETTRTTETTTVRNTISKENSNPFTGLPVSDEEKEMLRNRRPLLVSYDNLNEAWPQSGIASADYYMEILAEGLITRFLAIYYSNPPEIIGPIRSARPYIVLKAIEYDAFLAHVGGSEQALADIVNLGVADLDGLWSGAFRRIPPKAPPHNTYAYYADLITEAENQGYRMHSVPEFYDFGEINPELFKENAGLIRFDYRDYGVYGDSGYSVHYVYDGEKNVYTRLVNGEVCVDEIDDSPVTVSNILVQYATHEVLDDAGRLAIDLFSGGEGYLFRDGKVSKVTWSKEANQALTRFTHEDGSEILLTPGKTILHVVYPGIFQYSEE